MERARRSKAQNMTIIELAAAGIGQQLIETGAPGFHSADPVRVLVNDLESHAARPGRADHALGLGVLIDGGDAHVQGGRFIRAALSSSAPGHSWQHSPG